MEVGNAPAVGPMSIGGRDPEFKESLVDKTGLTIAAMLLFVAISSCEHVDFVPPDSARDNCACSDGRGVMVVTFSSDVDGVGGGRLTPEANDLILTTPLPSPSPVLGMCVPPTPVQPVASTNASVPLELTE